MNEVCGMGYRSRKVDRWSTGYFCQVCPQGQYTDTDNAASCTQCPQGITANEGSTNSSQCLGGKKLNIYSLCAHTGALKQFFGISAEGTIRILMTF